ncbi:MAG: MBL fold metallo-hydrolase [Candidatus Thorarchaeota archaeon]
MSEIELGPGINISREDNLKGVIKNTFDGLQPVKDAYLASIEENKRSFEEFISPGKSMRADNMSFLSILRKWNSYTPVLPQHGHPKGGGYFIHHNNVGIVIDPGYNFIQNFFEEKFKLDDIDVIIITHAHNDHTVELESIFALLFKRNNIITDKAEHKKIDVYLNLGTFKKFSGFFDLSHEDSPNYISNIVLLDSLNEYVVPKKGDSDISIISTKTQHHEMITRSYALGFILKCGDRTIRFTGDTGWNEDIEECNDKLMDSKQIDKIDILVPHLGSILTDEFKFDFDKSIEENIKSGKIFYSHHLGMLGSICMIHKHRPDLVVFSEFGEELKSIRKDVVQKISDAMKITCFPGDIGLHININDLSIFCCKKGEMSPFEKIEIFRVGDDLYYAAETSFTLGEKADKEQAIERIVKNKTIKKFHDLVQQ